MIKNYFLKVLIILAMTGLAGLGCTDIALAQTTDQTALIAQLQKQVQQLLSQLQALQKEVTELKTETGIQTSPIESAIALETTDRVDETASTLPELTRPLSLGTRGDDVRKLQEFLLRDKEIYPEGLATGFYGPKTAEAVKRWQKKNNIEVIGIVGPKTIAKFRELGQGALKGLIEKNTPSGMVPPGLLMMPGAQRQATTTQFIIPPSLPATSTAAFDAATTTPATPAIPAEPTQISATPATPATPAQPASSSSTSSNELKVTYPNGGETWYKNNSYTITWQNPLAGGFANQNKYYWNILLKQGNTAWQANDIPVPVTQSSYTWSKWTGWNQPIPNASDFKVGISLVDTCATQVGGVCPSANISIIPAGGIDYSDNYFTATTTPTTTTTAPLTVTWPNGGETFKYNLNYSITYASTGINRVGAQLLNGSTVVWSTASPTAVGSPLYFSISGVTNSTTVGSGSDYKMKVFDWDNNSVSDTSDNSFTIPAADIAAPVVSNVSASSITANSAIITWTTNEPATGFVNYGTPTTWTVTPTDTSYTTSHSFTLSNLLANSLYTYRVYSADYSGNGPQGYPPDYTFTTAGTTNDSAVIPNNASAVTGYVSGQIVNLQWTDNSSNETSFDIYRRSSGLNVTPGTWTKITQTSSNTITYSDSHGAGTWEYRVDACNSAGCASNSGTVQLTVSSSSGTTASTTPSASVYDQMREQLKTMEIVLRELLNK